MAEGLAGAPPSWDDTTPAEQAQQAAPPRPAAARAAPVVAAAPAPVPDQPPVGAPQTPMPTPDAPPSFDDTAPIETASNQVATDVGPDPLPPMEPNAAVRKFVDHNLQVYNALNARGGSRVATSWLEAAEAGLQMSVSGLMARQEAPDMTLPENSSRAMRIANQIGTLAGDLPFMALAGFGATAATAGTVAGIPAAPFAGAAASFAAPAALRKIMIDEYAAGHGPKTASEFADRAMGALWEGTKGAVTGLATEAVGPLAGIGGRAAGGLLGPMAARVGGEAAHFAANVGAMTTVGAGLEGHLPHADDFLDAAIVMGGLHATTVLPGKFREIYAKTGEHPAEVTAAMDRDIELKQQMLTEDPTSPPQAHPTDLVYPDKSEWDPTPVEGEERTPLTPEEKEAAAQPRLEPQSAKLPEPLATEDSHLSPEEQNVLSKIGEPAEAPQKSLRQSFDSFYAKNIDYLDPLAIAYTEAKKNGLEVPSEKNAYEQGRLLAGHLDRVRAFVEDGTRNGTSGEVNGEGLNQILRDVPAGPDGKPDLQAYRAYAMSARALELDDRGIKPWADFSREEAEKVVTAGKEKFEAINDRRVAFENRVLDYATEKGLFSAKQLEAMKTMNGQHIPFYRVMDPDTWTGKTAGGTAVKRIYGSDRSILDPLLSTYKNVEAIIRKADINDIRRNFVETMTSPEMEGTFIEKVEERSLPVRIEEDELANHLRNQGVEISSDELNPLTVFRPEKGSLQDNQFAVYIDGKRTVFTGEPDVIDSLRRLDGNATMMSAWTKWMSGFTKATRIGVTSDPGFAFRHFFRSQIMSGIYSQTGQIPFLHSALAAAEFMKGESEQYKNWLYDGGAVSSWDRMDQTYLQNNVEGAEKKAPFQKQAWNVITKPIHASEAFIKMTDNLTRFTEYKRGLDQGMSRAQAAFASREVTVDYQKQGLQRDVLRAGVAFIGAHINSIDRMAQAFKEQPKGTVAKLAALSAISGALWAVNKDDEAIQSLPNWQKDLYWNFRVPGASHDGTAIIFRLPKPWSPGILFGSGTEAALDAWKGTSSSRGDDFVHTIFSSVIPEPIPNMIAPPLEQFMNKSLFNGRPIVAEDKEKLLPELQYEPYTSETAKQVAKLIGYVPYVRDIGPSSDTLASPAVVENYVRGWTGTLGGWALRVSDLALQKSGVGPDHGENPDTLADNVFMREFLTRYPSAKEQPLQDFYKHLDQTNRVLTSIRYANRHGDADYAANIQSRFPDLEVKLTGIAKAISTARKTMLNVHDDPKIPAVEKRQLMDTTLFQIHSMAKMGNQMMKSFQNATSPPAAKEGQ